MEFIHAHSPGASQALFGAKEVTRRSNHDVVIHLQLNQVRSEGDRSLLDSIALFFRSFPGDNAERTRIFVVNYSKTKTNGPNIIKIINKIIAK